MYNARWINNALHDDISKWKHFPRPFVRGIHRRPVNSPHKGQWRGAFMFSLICVWVNGWVNNREAGDLRRHRAHYDVIVMANHVMKCISGWFGCGLFHNSRITYHGYAMRKILPLCRKTVTCKSKGFLCLFGHNSCIHCFCLKNLNLFSQNITFRVINYLNLVEKITRNWNVDEVSVPIISKDIR